MVNICSNKTEEIYKNAQKFQFHYTRFFMAWEFPPRFNEANASYYYGFLKDIFGRKNWLLFMGNDLEKIKTICIVPQIWQVIFSQAGLKKSMKHFPHPKLADSPKVLLHWPPVVWTNILF